MTETIRYSQIAREDIRWGRGTFEVVLADGRTVVLSEVGIVLVAPNGSKFKLEVDNDGTLTVVAA